VNPSTGLVLVNAIYFKGNWEGQFNKELTQESLFKVSKVNIVQKRHFWTWLMFMLLSKTCGKAACFSFKWHWTAWQTKPWDLSFALLLLYVTTGGYALPSFWYIPTTEVALRLTLRLFRLLRAYDIKFELQIWHRRFFVPWLLPILPIPSVLIHSFLPNSVPLGAPSRFCPSSKLSPLHC
jgi:hypothetical protein